MLHVEPPAAVLQQLICLRIHLDDCDAENGAINVIPGSHKMGLLRADELNKLTRHHPQQVCAIKKYGVLFIRPLLVHNAPPSHSPLRRRVLQIEYGYELGNGLQWHNQFQLRESRV